LAFIGKTSQNGKRFYLKRTARRHYSPESLRRGRRSHGRANGTSAQQSETTPQSVAIGDSKRTERAAATASQSASALAELQAQIVGIGHSLREEDLAEKKQRITPSTVDHEAEAESLPS
jgi:hypothetical protein